MRASLQRGERGARFTRMSWVRHSPLACVLACACSADGGSSGKQATDTASSIGSGQVSSTSSSDASAGGASSVASATSTSTGGQNASGSTRAGDGAVGGSTTTVTASTGSVSTSSTDTSTSTANGGGAATSTDASASTTAGGSSSGPEGSPVQEQRAAVPIARGEHGVGALNGEVYVLGGFTPTVTASVQAYSPEQDSWRDVADFPVVFHHPNVASVGGSLYVLGFHAGSGQRVADGSAYAYDPETDSWTERAPLPLGTERGASCVTTFEDKIYVFGGTNDIALPDASVYDPAEDSWEALPLLPMPRHHCIAAVVNDRIYIVSGRDVIIEEVQTESFVFDPETQSYEEVAPILTPRGGAAGGELHGRIYVFGGEGNINDENGIFHEAEEYDPSSDSWSPLPDMVVPRHGLGAAVIGDRMYLPGGSTRQGIQAQTTHTVFYFEAP